ncbi:MAG TPA: GGDEF domain-containing protein [Candidatus Acidoferrum sp.]|jgi:diguanylate cyclase (GGDEF)-like protein|nr:GGDEF domain-containing protein [Candidatus Acidoferrum sp.]
MARLVLTALVFVVLGLALTPAGARAAARTEMLVAPGGPAIVIGPSHAELMTVRVRGITRRSGRHEPTGPGPLGHAVTAVPLPADLRPGEAVTVTLEPASAGSVRIVRDEPAYDEAIAAARGAGIMLGVLLAIAALQIAAFTIVREPSIPFYVAFVITLAAIELLRDGVLPTFGLGRGQALLLLDVVNGVVDIAFIIVYLRLWSEARALFWWTVAACVVPAVAAAALAFAPHVDVELVRAPLILLGSIVLVVVIVARARRFPPAWYLAAALGTLYASVLYRTLRAAAPLAVPFFDRWAFELATTTDAILFAIAIIARVRYALRERRQLQAQLDEATRQALEDELTGALNRRGLFAQLEQAPLRGLLFAIDLDRFKTINDRFGHAAGDIVLKRVVSALHETAGDQGIVARIGGDEFIVVVPDADPRDGAALAERFTATIVAIRDPLHGVSGEHFGASIGYAVLDDQSFLSALRAADQLAYREKSRKRVAREEMSSG